jgi:aryl-alcohol dehydrogenase-like predicted oxidoreductase
MTILTIDIPAPVYDRLRAIAEQQGKPIEEIAQAWLIEQSTRLHAALPTLAPPGERERAIAVLRQAGLLAESGPELKARAARSRLTLDEARAILDRDKGKPLSEIIMEMRGPKT